MSSDEEILGQIYKQTIDGLTPPVVALTRQALDAGIDPSKILADSLIPALEEVGKLFEANEYYVPEMLVSAKAMNSAMDILKPLIAETGAKPTGTFLMGTVEGDIHDIGKNLCSVMLRGGGFEVIDVGVNVPPAEFVAAIREHRPQAVGLSAFLTTTLPMCKTTIDAIAAAGLRGEVKIFVGGAPVTQTHADQVGADGYAPNGSALLRALKEMLGAQARADAPRNARAPDALLAGDPNR